MTTQDNAMMERTSFLLPDVVAADTGFTKDDLEEDIELILTQRTENIEAEAGNGVEMERPVRVMPSNEGHFEIGAEIDGDRGELPL